MKANLIEVISYITAVQLFILGFVLITKRQKTAVAANRILALFMFSNALLISYFILEVYLSFPVPSVDFFYFFLAPLLYLYTRSLTKQGFQFRRKMLLHFIPGGAAFLYTVIGAIIINNIRTDPAQLAKQQFTESFIFSGILHIQIWIYLAASFVILFRYRRNLKNTYSAIEKINLTWLLFILMAFMLMWFADLSHFLLSINHLLTAGTSRLLVFISLLINFIFANAAVYYGLNYPQLLILEKEPVRNYKTGLSEEECRIRAKELQQFMVEKKPYLEPSLTIADLSEQIDIHQKYLSQIINSQFNQNFYDFINFYRIGEAKSMMDDRKKQHATVLEILYEAGFNSKSAFNSAFKKNTGITPTEYKRGIPSGS